MQPALAPSADTARPPNLASTQDFRPVPEVMGVSKAFAGVSVLHGIDLARYPGEVQALLGKNGAHARDAGR